MKKKKFLEITTLADYIIEDAKVQEEDEDKNRNISKIISTLNYLLEELELDRSFNRHTESVVQFEILSGLLKEYYWIEKCVNA